MRSMSDQEGSWPRLVKSAFELLDKMEHVNMQPNQVNVRKSTIREVTDSMVGSFLNGCVVYNILDLARKMGENVMKMEINRPDGFVTLSKIYAGKEDWAKVEMSRENSLYCYKTLLTV
ncbi:tetratricopeptide-like helical domain-containing protein [Artemisia annua]|uniref:Tetratricopeptide-like helical domain-containing protein n=1 Tax=Artemisia annua TaxID=35608 RepID=A0A2U1KF05_ARTAN|nr:tetratricopeptide-like helical domain-containing protein [Artemisia annua]